MDTLSHDRPERLYRSLLRLFPRAFRDRFGADMTELFRDRRRAALLRGGRAALPLFWIRTIADVVTQAAGEHLDVRGTPSRHAALHPKEGHMGTFLHDLPHAIRALLRQPAFLAVAVLTLALGIGANTAIFTVVHGVLLKPYPFPEPQRLLFMGETEQGSSGLNGASYQNVQDWRERSRTIDRMSLWFSQSVNLTGGAEPDRVRGAFITHEFFELTGLTAHLGRTLRADDDKPGAPRVTVLDYKTWEQRYASDPHILGRTLILNNEHHTVVGVTAPGFWFPYEVSDLYIPAHFHPTPVARGRAMYAVIGRLKPDVTIEQARADMTAVARGLAEEYPKENAGRTIAMRPMQELVVGRDTRRSLLILSGAVAFVLLIACVNLANLLLARGAGRHRELAVRAALGATRGRLFAQLLTESVLLATIGGLAGLLLAFWGVPVLVAQAPAILATSTPGTISGPVIAFALTLSVLTGLVFGTLPAMRLSRADLQSRLRDGARGTDGGSQRVRSVLVVAEIALSLMLLVGAGLLTRSLLQLLDESPGFKAENVLSLEYRLPPNKYRTPADQWRFHEQVAPRVAQVPGVTSAALVSGLAFSGNGGGLTFRLPDATDGTTATEYRAQSSRVTPDYFQTMGIPVQQGRVCTAADQANTPPVVMINQQLAERAFPHGSPIGARMIVSDPVATATIVGVVGNTKHNRLSETIGPQVYGCYAQYPGIFATLVARTGVEPMSLERAVKTAIWSIDRDQPVWKVRTVESLLDANLAPRRYEMWLMVGTALVALLLAIVGIYGVMSYMVNQRTREIGVRMALGAGRREIARLVVGRALVLTVAGLILGLVGARFVMRFLSAMLFGVTASDAITYAAVAVLLTTVALLASYVPARRAMRVDPVRALRAD